MIVNSPRSDSVLVLYFGAASHAERLFGYICGSQTANHQRSGPSLVGLRFHVRALWSLVGSPGGPIAPQRGSCNTKQRFLKTLGHLGAFEAHCLVCFHNPAVFRATNSTQHKTTKFYQQFGFGVVCRQTEKVGLAHVAGDTVVAPLRVSM